MSMDSERIGIMFYHYIEKGGCFMEKSVSEKNKRVILVSGMSGAGKSVATRSLEDMGYHVIDNFPVQLVSLLVDMI